MSFLYGAVENAIRIASIIAVFPQLFSLIIALTPFLKKAVMPISSNILKFLIVILDMYIASPPLHIVPLITYL